MAKDYGKEIASKVNQNFSTIILVIAVIIFTGATLMIAAVSYTKIVKMNCSEKNMKRVEIFNRDYTFCLAPDDHNLSCHKFSAEELNESVCICYEDFHVNETIHNATLYYEIDMSQLVLNESVRNTFNQSRDDNQLSGRLTTPSSSCEPYAYIDPNTKTLPIVPCGAIANYMLTDDFSLFERATEIPVLSYGLLPPEEKQNYKNPRNSIDLRDALTYDKYAKPKDWHFNLHFYKLDSYGGDIYNGFQNERFIAWMNTTKKTKPVWRLSETLLEKNHNYSIHIAYHYPASLYNGTRKIILNGYIESEPTCTPVIDNESETSQSESPEITTNTGMYAAGIVFICIGLLTFVIAVGLVIQQRNKLKNTAENGMTTSPKAPVEEERPFSVNKRASERTSTIEE